MQTGKVIVNQAVTWRLTPTWRHHRAVCPRVITGWLKSNVLLLFYTFYYHMSFHLSDGSLHIIFFPFQLKIQASIQKHGTLFTLSHTVYRAFTPLISDSVSLPSLL